MTSYLDRELGLKVAAALAALPVVVISGLRQSGKTTFLQHDARLRDRRYVTLDDWPVLEQARRDPDAFVAGDEPLTVDEAQRCPELLLAVKRIVDRRRRPGQIVLSGSANFRLLRSVGESLAGRAVYLPMHPLTRRERARATQIEPWLAQLFAAGELPRRREFTAVTDEEVLRGGMPQLALDPALDRDLWLRGYEQSYLERDVRDLAQVADLAAFRRVLRLTALRSGQLGNESGIGRDAKLPATTTGRYLDLLETSFVLQRLPPFVRGRSQRLIKTPKVYFADSGLAAYLADVAEIDARAGERLRGALYETYVAQNLRAIVDLHLGRAELAFWHVQGRHEVDFVVATARAAVAIEIKAAARFDDADLAGLRAFA
ncbi:MAG TPA: ATP-binding protein, partial [Burkholderiaceae bacterium]|nr:ATP-binding protein [Burkholderiaceae bacterium]